MCLAPPPGRMVRPNIHITKWACVGTVLGRERVRERGGRRSPAEVAKVLFLKALKGACTEPRLQRVPLLELQASIHQARPAARAAAAARYVWLGRSNR